jgi:hypothetical protein
MDVDQNHTIDINMHKIFHTFKVKAHYGSLHNYVTT